MGGGVGGGGRLKYDEIESVSRWFVGGAAVVVTVVCGGSTVVVADWVAAAGWAVDAGWDDAGDSGDGAKSET
jgi:hypothetical protein